MHIIEAGHNRCNGQKPTEDKTAAAAHTGTEGGPHVGIEKAEAISLYSALGPCPSHTMQGGKADKKILSFIPTDF